MTPGTIAEILCREGQGLRAGDRALPRAAAGRAPPAGEAVTVTFPSPWKALVGQGQRVGVRPRVPLRRYSMGDLQISGQGGTCRTGAGGRASTPGRGDGDGHVPHPWKRNKEFGWDPGYPGGDTP